MTTYSLARHFTLADIPPNVGQCHRDNFEAVLRQRQARDEAYREARHLQAQADSGMPMSQPTKRRLTALWARYRVERHDYKEMLQNAMDELTTDHPWGLGDH